jgi:hypothetical protein
MRPETPDEWWRTGSLGIKILGYAGLAAWVTATIAWFLQRYFATEEPTHSIAHETMEVAWLVLAATLIGYYWSKWRSR